MNCKFCHTLMDIVLTTADFIDYADDSDRETVEVWWCAECGVLHVPITDEHEWRQPETQKH